MVGRVDIDATAPAADQPHGPSPGRVLPILAVDDRAENLIALEAVLEPLGLPIVTATSGEEALRLLLEHDFSLILLDVRMPGMDGLETAQLIKSRERTREVPIVFLTAARDELGDIMRGYGLGAVDYVIKPFDPEVLRSKVAVFTQLEQSRRQLRRSEALLRGAFDAAPVGKTLLDLEDRIVRANPAFARLVGAGTEELVGRSILEVCHPDDRDVLSALLARTAEARRAAPDDRRLDPDLRLLSGGGATVWAAPAASAIEPERLGVDLLLVQWVDMSARRRAEEARADLLIEHAGREQAEALADRLEKLRRLVEPVDAGGLDDVLSELARRLTDAFGADAAEVEVEHHSEGGTAGRSLGMHVRALAPDGAREDDDWVELPLMVEAAPLGKVRLLPAGRGRLEGPERELLHDAVERISLMIRRTQLHEEERRIALELQRGLLPAHPPELEGVAIAAQLDAAGLATEIGGDWYDSFLLPDGRLAAVIGDVTGSGIRAASTMGQIRSVTRAFALGDPDPPPPAEVLARVQRYHQMTGFEELVTMIYLILDPSSGRLVWANAGHPPPLLRAGNGEVHRLSGADSIIYRIDAAYHDREVTVGEGDMLVLYTDGLVERRGESLDAGIDRLARAIKSGPDDPGELCAQLLTAAQACGEPPADDLTVLALKLTGRAGRQSARRRRGFSGQRVQVTLTPDIGAPSAARSLLERSFEDELDPDELQRAKLALSELATNAVRHGCGEITVLAELDPARLLVEVIDEGAGFEHVVREAELEATGGWGLRVVDAEVSRWGIHEGTARVWFEIERRGAPVGAEQR